MSNQVKKGAKILASKFDWNIKYYGKDMELIVNDTVTNIHGWDRRCIELTTNFDDGLLNATTRPEWIYDYLMIIMRSYFKDTDYVSRGTLITTQAWFDEEGEFIKD